MQPDPSPPFNPMRAMNHADAIPDAPCETSGVLAETVPLDYRYINIRPEMLARAAAEEPERFGPFAPRAESFLDALTHVLDMETAALRQALEREYAHFNPDSIDPPPPIPDASNADRARALCDRFRYLFEKANFTRLNDQQIEEAINAANSQGLRVRLNPEAIEHLDLFVRGIGTVERRRPCWKKPIRGEAHELNVYRRLGVVMRLKGSEEILLKLFRDIPVADIEALLPHAQIAMNGFDRIKVFFGGIGACGGLAMKIAKGGVFLAPSSLAIPAVVALGGLSFRSFFGYRRARHLRVSQRIYHLYHQNLAGNAAVLHLLLSVVTTQEIGEALLLYAHLAGRPNERDAAEWETAARLDIERWLLERFDSHVSFEIDDAIETLDRLQLWRDRSRLNVLDPASAVEHLHAHARERRTADYHLRQLTSRDREQVQSSPVADPLHVLPASDSRQALPHES